MAIISKNDFKQMNEAQLGEKLLDLKKELMKINTQISTGTVPENPGMVSEVKKTIARIITVLSLKNKQKLEKKEEKTVKKTEKKSKEASKKQ
ncbi:MAG: 50S ribosomal protein L29 [Nanoarchaeota archaeon]|nr:50S ribosomal protein L29 [Nanoarchaeota archaeon]